MKVNIQSIAERAGVSTATVSRAFSRKCYVKAETRARVLAVAGELGFEPKAYKKRTAESAYRGVVGVMLPAVNNNFYHEIIVGIEEVLDKFDIDILLCDTGENTQKEIRYLDLFRHIRPSGLIIVPVSEKAEENRVCLRELAAEIPVILLDRDLPGENLDGVFMNNYGSAYQGTKLLLSEGHRRIAFICGFTTSTSGSARLNGYRQALADAKVQTSDDYILYGGFNTQIAYAETKEFLKKHIQVTAFFSSSCAMADGCLLALAESGLYVPRDMGFLTFGRSEWQDRGISYLRYPSLEMGRECAKTLLDSMQSAKRAKKSPRKRSIFEMSLERKGSERLPDAFAPSKENV